MAQALLITQADIKALTSLNGNVDTDKIMPYIKIAQDIHLTRLLGSVLIKKIQADIIGNTLTGNYQTLVVDYCKPVLIHYTMSEFLPFMAYSLSNKGVYKHTAESSESVQKNEVDYLAEKERTHAQYYAQRLTDYLCHNSSLFPEYTTYTPDGVSSTSNNYTGGWVI
jgi:hypothetical protein